MHENSPEMQDKVDCVGYLDRFNIGMQ